MKRSLTLQNILDKKFVTLSFNNELDQVFGFFERNGIWLIWGQEKNGKTWIALKLAECFTEFGKVLYISGEEGMGKTFTDACIRAKMNPQNRRLNFQEYLSYDEINELISPSRGPKFIIIDNMTVYADEFKNGQLRNLIAKHPTKLFIFLAHEDRKEPYTATAKLCRKLAKVIIHVKGLTGFVSGRCPGGILIIDEEKAKLFHGDHIKTKSNV